MSCACDHGFLVEACDLQTGGVKTVLHPTQMEWTTELHNIGQGTITLPARSVQAINVWPGKTVVYISRVDTGEAVFAGIVWDMRAYSTGNAVLGLRSIESYLEHRTLGRGHVMNQWQQTFIAWSLITSTIGQGDEIQLFASWSASQIIRDRRYTSYSYKNLWEALKQLHEVQNGPEWRLIHQRSETGWKSNILWEDRIGGDRGETLAGDANVFRYDLQVSARELANHVDAVNSQDDDPNRLHASATDDEGFYPRMDHVIQQTDTTQVETLFEAAEGYLETHKDATTLVSATVAGLDPMLNVQLGDTVQVVFSFGLATHRGPARVVGISWGVGGDDPVIRSFDLETTDGARSTVLNQTPDQPCKSNNCRSN